MSTARAMASAYFHLGLTTAESSYVVIAFQLTIFLVSSLRQSTGPNGTQLTQVG